MMRRGQAFETMMLVISVIVALAILAVLMNIIGGIGGIGQGEPDKLMRDKLKDIVTAGYGCSAPTKTVLKRGSTIFAKQVRSDIVSVTDTDDFRFTISSQNGAGLTQQGNTVANAKLVAANLNSPEAQIYFIVCGDTSGAQKAKFNVCVSTRDNDQTMTACAP